jgi:uncharacterized protein (DUF1501 family)
MSLSRREFLTAGAASAAVVSSSTNVPGFLLHAAAGEARHNGDNVLVVLQLSGGNDGLNTVVPYADDIYHRNRFATRVDESDVLRIDDYVGLHPAMKGMAHLLENRRLAIVQGVGYANPNRSHFESMDIWHSARRDGGHRQVGWLGRYLDASARLGDDSQVDGRLAAVHLGSEVQPLALAGLRIHAPSISSLDAFQLDDGGRAGQREAIQRLIDAPRAEAHDLVAYVRAAAQTAVASSRRVRKAMGSYSTPVKYPASGLAEKLRGVAQLIEAGLSMRVYYLALDGFDTHSEQTEAHAALLTELSESLAAFVDDLVHHGHDQRVLVMCFSEFGRRVKENASRGTDHGAAAPMFLAGGAVRGGLFGNHPDLSELADGDPRFHTDFRRVYATVLEHWLDVGSEPVLGDRFEPLPLLQPA